jgi:ubiquinone/menaquinone biosynthesis C-methylase UbiE
MIIRGEFMEDIKKGIVKTYNEIAEHFDVTRVWPWKECTEFTKTMPKNSLILDLGCGTGRHCKMILQHDNKVVGIDISKKQLGITKKKNKKAMLVMGDVVNIPFKDKVFDAVLFIATLHHLNRETERIKSLKELERVLKNKGNALISVWAYEQERFKGKKKDVFVSWTTNDGRIYQRFCHLFIKNELEDLIKKSNLKLIKSFRSGDNYFGIVSIN